MSESPNEPILNNRENPWENSQDTPRENSPENLQANPQDTPCENSCESSQKAPSVSFAADNPSGRFSDKNDYAAELQKTGAIAFVPSGVSMWPTLKNRGQTVIVTAKKERLKRYDVALFIRRDGKYVLHRVMEPKEGGYIICGDSQFVTENVKEEQVIGVMEGFYRGKKYISCEDEAYKKEVEEWFAKKTRRKIKLKVFYFFRGVRGKLGAAARKLGLRKNKEKV